jgi:Family of unknown function (DUF6496)
MAPAAIAALAFFGTPLGQQIASALVSGVLELLAQDIQAHASTRIGWAQSTEAPTMPSSQVMHKFKKGKLHSGGKSGPVVTNPKQAVAIKLSEERKEKATGSADTRGKKARNKRLEKADL